MNGPISSWIVRMGNSSSQCWSLSVAEVFHLDKKPGTVMIKKKKLCGHPLRLQVSRAFGLWISLVSLNLLQGALAERRYAKGQDAAAFPASSRPVEALWWPGCLGMFPAAVKLSQVNQGSLETYAHAAASPFQIEEAAPFWSRDLHWGHNTGGDGN